MANYIKNRLIINGTNEQVQEVKDFLKPKKPTHWENQEESTEMDFDNITPMPKWVYGGDLTRNEEQKYGKENCWYEWRKSNWGTKWNAWDTRSYKNIIDFKTAWNGVPSLMEKLAWIFPNVDFEYMFADEDIGYNVGHYCFKDTNKSNFNIIKGSKKAYELAFELWNCEDDYSWNSETQEYEYIGE